MAAQQQQKQQHTCTAPSSSSTPSSAPSSKLKTESIIPLFDLVQGHDPYNDIPEELSTALKDYFVAAAEKVQQSNCECCSCCGGDVDGRLPLLLSAFYRSLQSELLQGVAVMDMAEECSKDIQGRYRLAVVAVLAAITKAAHNDDVAKQLLRYIGQQELGNAARVAAHAGCARIIAQQRVVEQLGKPLDQCCNEHLAQLLPIFRDTLKEVQKCMGSSTTDDVALTADQAMIWSTAVSLLQAPGVTAADAAAVPAESSAAAAAEAVRASRAPTAPADAAAVASSSGGGWGAFSSLAGLFRGITSRKVSSAAGAGDAAAGRPGKSGHGAAQRSSIYASAAAGAASGGAAQGGALVLANAGASDVAESEEDTFEQEVKLKFWSPASADYPETLEAITGELDCIKRLALHTDCNEEGWNALHYAAATHKVTLVRQLLEIGANPCKDEDTYGLKPLHLACMGRVKNEADLEGLIEACENIYNLQKYAMLAGPACRPLVQLLLSQQIDPTSAVDCFFDELAGLTPLHLLACWHYTLSASPTGSGAPWLRAAAAQHIGAVRDILQAHSSDGSSADVEGRTVSCKETPLTFAAFSGSWAVVELLLQAGANPNLPRLADAVRPLDLAVALRHSRLACLLLERGAEVNPSEAQQAWAGMAAQPAPARMQPNMLLLNAVECGDAPHNARLVELLLQRGAPLEEVNEKGETALLSAVMFDNAEMVRLLVAAGANMETARQKGLLLTPLAEAAVDGQLEILQILLDAGAEYTSYRNEHTGYNIVQLAANGGQFEAAVKLVEAGASWRLAAGKERMVNGNLFYVPDILSSKLPGVKVGTIESKLHAAEKVAKQRKDKAAAEEARSKRSSNVPLSNDAAACGAAAQEQQQPAADVDDLDALAAEIEALGGSSSNPAAAASVGSKKNKKQEKLKKQRAKQQQKQQQRSTAQSSREASEDEEEPAASSAAAAADHLSELLGDVSLKALQRIAEAGSSAAAKQQHSTRQQHATQRPQPKQQQASQLRQQREQEQQLEMQQQQQQQQQLRQQKKEVRLQQRAAAHAAKSRPPPGVAVASFAAAAQQAAMQQAAMQQAAELQSPTAAPATSAAAAAAQLAARSPAAAAGAAKRVTRAQGATANTGPTSSAGGSSNALPAAAVPPASIEEPAAAAAPSMLESWRGSLNPIFMWGRSSSNGNSAPAKAAGAGRQIYNPQQFEQQQQHASPAVPSATMAALQGAQQGVTQQAHQKQRSVAPAEAPAAAGAAASDGAGNSKVQTQQECIVCMERLRDVLLLPCKHLVLCSCCAEQMEGRGALDSCPYCRQTCVKRVRVHQ